MVEKQRDLRLFRSDAEYFGQWNKQCNLVGRPEWRIPGVLRAYDATNLATEFYNSSTGAGDNFNDNKFIAPTIANGKAYVGTPTSVVVFGLKP